MVVEGAPGRAEGGGERGGGAPALCTGRGCFLVTWDSLQVLEQITLILFGFYKGFFLSGSVEEREGGRERQEGREASMGWASPQQVG